MHQFSLPDLGEGLHEAEIVAWALPAGSAMQRGETVLSVETAKAIVDIPAPLSGRLIAQLAAQGAVVAVGTPLFSYQEQEAIGPTAPQDGGSVVGELPQGPQKLGDSPPEIGLSEALPEGYSLLRGMARHMAQQMSRAQQQVAQVTLFDHVHLRRRKHLLARTLLALRQACQEQGHLNAWYHAHPAALRLHSEVRVGLAIATSAGLLVPVLDVHDDDDREILETRIHALRERAEQRQLSPAELTGATISLSNFGSLGGRYGTPMVMPPQVAILGIGRLEKIARHDYELPLSLSFDHRACTGAQAAAFLGSLIEALTH